MNQEVKGPFYQDPLNPQFLSELESSQVEIEPFCWDRDLERSYSCLLSKFQL